MVAEIRFVLALEEAFPTWWADQRGPVLTAWAGGPKADALLRRGPFSSATPRLTHGSFPKPDLHRFAPRANPLLTIKGAKLECCEPMEVRVSQNFERNVLP